MYEKIEKNRYVYLYFLKILILSQCSQCRSGKFSENSCSRLNMTAHHISVLLPEVIHAFAGKQLRVFVDATLGAGGHAAAILETHPEIELFIGIDQDPVALEIARKRLTAFAGCTKFIAGNFEQGTSQLPIGKVDGFLFDLGVSSMQLDQPEKGFSFMREGPLDMRMNPEGQLTAADIINTYSEKELGQIFRDYGEEKQWRAAARAVVTARSLQPIKTTLELAAVLRPVLFFKKKGINPLTLIFQALRICVNRELEVIEKTIPKAIDLLANEGRLAVISFHSLEDRIVKNCFRFAASDKYDTSGWGGVFLDKTPQVKIITKKPIEPSEQEVEANPRSRSAKLRVVEKI